MFLPVEPRHSSFCMQPEARATFFLNSHGRRGAAPRPSSGVTKWVIRRYRRRRPSPTLGIAAWVVPATYPRLRPNSQAGPGSFSTVPCGSPKEQALGLGSELGGCPVPPLPRTNREKARNEHPLRLRVPEMSKRHSREVLPRRD